MVLPRTHLVEGREIRISVLAWRQAPAHSGYVDTNISFADFGYLRSSDAVLQDPHHTDEAVEKPYTARGIYGLLEVAEPFVAVPYVVPGADDSECGQDDVGNEKHLVRPFTHVQATTSDHDRGGEGSNNAPCPPREVVICLVAACT